jgi:deoxyribodipyrimidine photo-lyase
MSTALVLFTRDLRVYDQTALTAAVRDAERIVPAFVFDEQLLAGRCSAANRLAFLLDSLADLDRSLRERGGQLVVRRGELVDEVMRLARSSNAGAIYMSDDVSAYARRRHRLLTEACQRERIQLRTFPGLTVVPSGELTPSGGGDHYRVFTPYWRAWSGLPRFERAGSPRRISLPRGIRAGTLPSLKSLTRASTSPELPAGGERAAREQLRRWLPRELSAYQEHHDNLAGDRTSRLSPFLHFGCLSPATVLARAESHHGPGGEAFARQLCWRDFHHQVLAARPDLPYRDYRPRGDRWHRGKRLTEAWQQGRTGYPIVDAGMRQLALEGFMHNRARLIVASFLTKLLYIDWRVGAAHFDGLLVDADLANNVGNWQWVAGTGNDTRPNRVLNPIRQAHRFDPTGEYVRRYVPELSGVTGRALHEPWRMPAAERRTLDYPPPVLDHVAAAEQLRVRRG